MDLQPGARLQSRTSEVQVVVVRCPSGATDLRCGGYEMVPVGEDPGPLVDAVPGTEGTVQMGKRYCDAAGTVELLCTKAGGSALSVGQELLEVKSAKPLPSSD